MRSPVVGTQVRWAALRAAYGGGLVGALAATGYTVVRAEATLARRTIGQPTQQAPDAGGRYGTGPGPVLRFAMLGDSSAAGLGCDEPAQTPGALLAGGLAAQLARPVELDVLAGTGARSSHLDTQVARALRGPVDVAAVMIGANDVTHRVGPADAARDLARAVRTLRAAGAVVVVGTCPDLGTVEPLLQPLRSLARTRSRALARAQLVAVVENDGTAVSLADLLGPEFAASPQLWSADRFHPSPAGYARVAGALLPSLLRLCGVPVGQDDGTVQDVEVGATVAAQTSGLVLETMPDGDGVAAPGPGRLTRLRRRLPVVVGGIPASRTAARLPAPPAGVGGERVPG